ncbi:tRNA(Phe) wybutosine-synthesizing methylase [Emydomyces testavorans]|uniref:tRNA(Phe) 7-[(3-amino-3-carboxypropyl)-4-demethylwyosine(37)-N(4)]-methyltransferase n=1 Tax=Emydomyces testavorans TaxID=2070801 RepID=A0AAF0IHD1_9EURO|nr:tRNA(Phe) wybutosine-synthesizing methylase [Emydomyces testavorans]
MTTSRSFEAKKQKILNDLSLPEEEYTDLSPKGSVDAGIRDLIRDINRLQGLVTTSSCAGRISVFLEGTGTSVGNSQSGERRDEKSGDDRNAGIENTRQFAVSGGKGSGRWQFVSHDPVEIGDSARFLHDLFGLNPGNGTIRAENSRMLRLVRFHFEPMILHVMAESLKRAQPVLAAASSAGFRESGIQSLRCLDDSNACPIVAVRSSGLALQSIIGYADESNSTQEATVHSLVSEEYLRMLVTLANERFQSNYTRMDRFRVNLLALSLNPQSKRLRKKGEWEDADLRRERKHAEGIRRRELAEQAAQPKNTALASDDEIPLTFLEVEG